MALTLSRCNPSDAHAFAEACICTYERMPRHIATMGSIPRERQIEIFTPIFRDTIESQAKPTSNKAYHCLKVTDSSTDELVAFATWVYWPNGYKAEEDSSATVKEVPDGANERLMKDFAKLTAEIRSEHEGRNEPHWLLSLLGTHPKHERRGAAAMLIRWAFPHADKAHERCYVEGSSVAYKLYKRCGFEEDVGEISCDLDQYFDKGLGVHKWVAMLREPQTATSG